MPRQARLDTPGALHHVIVRGIEKRPIVQTVEDREDFVAGLAAAARTTGTAIYAWALLNNHAHLLLRSGRVGLPAFMRKWLTGYAIRYNHRHHRYGHLFQNRYKSILCQEEPYLLELVRYLHLNPVRAAVVKDIRALDRYPWSGHSALMGYISRPWQAVGEVLGRFGASRATARRAYRAFVADGVAQGRRPELTGGGLVRSAGGWGVLTAHRRLGDRLHGDERILGGSDFVDAALTIAGERLERRHRRAAQQRARRFRRQARLAEHVWADPGRSEFCRAAQAAALFDDAHDRAARRQAVPGAGIPRRPDDHQHGSGSFGERDRLRDERAGCRQLAPLSSPVAS